MVGLQVMCRASKGSGEGQCLWLGHLVESSQSARVGEFVLVRVLLE
jgi:hypothetical protein